MENKDINEAKVLKEIETAHRIWHWMANGLHWLQVILGIVAVVSSIAMVVLAKSKCPSLLCECDTYLSGIAAASLALLAAFGITQKGNNARNAWRHLQTARLLYYAEEITLKELIKAYEEAERIVGSVDFSFQIPPNYESKPDKQ